VQKKNPPRLFGVGKMSQNMSFLVSLSHTPLFRLHDLETEGGESGKDGFNSPCAQLRPLAAKWSARIECSLDAGVAMKIDIDKLSEEELVDLNHRIVERLRFLSQMRAHSKMLNFRIGERVTFHPEGRPVLAGVITRYNKKILTVITDSGQHWNVAPGLLRKAVSTDSADTRTSKVVRLRKE
jgi:hypothetical protein